MEEEESMVVCLGCEEWFHEGCLVSPLKNLVDIVVVFSVPRYGDGGRVV
jgi:hypothetical protein